MVSMYGVAKRAIDFSVASASLIVSIPILALLGLYIYFTDGSPVIFKSDRVGLDKEIFTVYKFRTLKNGLKRRKDGLSTPVVINGLAGFMRDTHLDEILQLINVVKGEMSLIGPRPLDVPRYNHLVKENIGWNHIHDIKPGMTCVNQIARYTNWGMFKIRQLDKLEGIKRRNRLFLDQYYVSNESIALDSKITYWTVKYLVGGFLRKIKLHSKK